MDSYNYENEYRNIYNSLVSTKGNIVKKFCSYKK